MKNIHKKRKAIIIGAGPSGLVVARELVKKGLDVEIFEDLDMVGGMCRSFTWRGYVLDIGPHIFHTSDEKLEKYWKKEFGDLLTEGVYWSQNVQGRLFDKFYDYPLSWESISCYPKNIRENIIKETSELNIGGKASAKSYSEYIDSIAGKTLRKMFFDDFKCFSNTITGDTSTYRI